MISQRESHSKKANRELQSIIEETSLEEEKSEKHRRKSLRYYHEDGGRERAYSQLTTEEIGAIVDETRRRLEQTKEKFLTHVELQQLKGQIPKPVDAETQRIVEMVSDECINKVCVGMKCFKTRQSY